MVSTILEPLSAFRGRPETLRTTRYIRCCFLGGCRRVPRCPLSSNPKLSTQEKRSIEDALLLSLRHRWTLAGITDSPLFVCRDHSTPPLLGDKHGMESLASRWSYAENSWFLTRSSDNTNVHLARFIAGAERAGLDVRDSQNVRVEQRALGGLLRLLTVNRAFAGLPSASVDASEMCFPFVVRQVCRELVFSDAI